MALVTLAALLGVLAAAPAAAQFGQNKVQYHGFDWKVLETQHFNIYYYSRERATALEAARMAERSYAYLSEFFAHEVSEKIPLVLYSNHQDFEQSNIIGGFISEGTGGVTESLKGRVTLPLTGSLAELNHVMTHELVHAFQFDLLKRNVRGMLGIGPLPLWMMEGMAEWVSNGMDPVTAMWVMDAVRRKKLPTVDKMATLQDIRVYRMGQALYDVIGKSYGPERVRRILKRPEPPKRAWRDSLFVPPNGPPAMSSRDADPTAPDSMAFAPGSVAGTSLEKRWKTFADSLTKEIGTGLVDPDSAAVRITDGTKYGRSFHLAPVLSPDGKRMLYYTSRGFHNELFLAESDGTKWTRRPLVAGEETPSLESLPLLSASADWSPDAKQVVFVGTRQGKDALLLYDLERGKVVRQIDTELLSISNPSFSPDGHSIVFSGLEGGQEDLFVVDAATRRLTRLTQDAYSERTPRFAPDGASIAFATDRGPKDGLRGLQFGAWSLARIALHPDNGVLVADAPELLTRSGADDFAPVWSPDGSQLAFISDRDGTYQVYTLDLAGGQVRRRTQFDAGVVGIVPSGPAISWSKSGALAFSVFRNGGWNLYRMEGFPLDVAGDADERRMAATRSKPKQIEEEAKNDVVKKDRDYHARLTPEYAVLGALYIGNTGAAGSGQLLLSDMLENHYLLIAGNLRSSFDESEFLLQYANLGHRWQWGLAGYQFRDDILFRSTTTGEIHTLIRRGAGAQLAYPFNRFERVEFGLEFQAVSNKVAQFLFETGAELGRTDSYYYYALPGVSFVHDNAAFSGFTPVAGSRWRTEMDQAVGKVGFTFGLLDYRRYLNVHTRGALAARLVVAGSAGKNPQLLRIGGPDTFRGSDYGEVAGTRASVANLEFRFPIIPTTELVRGIVFMDAATSWDKDHVYDLASRDPNGDPLSSLPAVRVRDVDVAFAYGVGLRGFIGLPLRFDAAVPTNFKKSGNWRTTFSIGFDF